MNKTYRIKDIAQLSGVSTGTVDRILHKRGKVSIEAREKVDQVLKEINYQPNLIARSLALKKKYKFITITPFFTAGEYWAKFEEGVDKAEQELFSYNVTVERLHFNQYDKASFDDLIQQVVDSACQGVVVATLFKESVRALTAKLDRLDIPYILVDSFIDKTNCISYYGTHSYDSGYIAGRLIFGQITTTDPVAIFRFIRQGDQISTQVARREEGFRDYLETKAFEGRIYIVPIHADDHLNNKKQLLAFFQKHQEVHAGVIFNSRAYLLASYFQELGLDQNIQLIGYDVLEANMDYLRTGLITHLIAQRPEVQGINSVKALFRQLVLNEKIEPINYMPIDILMKENMDYYNNYI